MSLFGQESDTILVENGEEPCPVQQSEHSLVMWMACSPSLELKSETWTLICPIPCQYCKHQGGLGYSGETLSLSLLEPLFSVQDVSWGWTFEIGCLACRGLFEHHWLVWCECKGAARLALSCETWKCLIPSSSRKALQKYFGKKKPNTKKPQKN